MITQRGRRQAPLDRPQNASCPAFCKASTAASSGAARPVALGLPAEDIRSRLRRHDSPTYLEGKEPFGSRVREALAAADRQHPGLGAAVSRLTWLECRVGPMKADHRAVLAAYDAFFAQPDLEWVELSKDVVELAAVIRVRHGLRTPDALQAASCLQLGEAHSFLTGDPVFHRVAGLNVQVLT